MVFGNLLSGRAQMVRDGGEGWRAWPERGAGLGRRVRADAPGSRRARRPLTFDRRLLQYTGAYGGRWGRGGYGIGARHAARSPACAPAVGYPRAAALALLGPGVDEEARAARSLRADLPARPGGPRAPAPGGGEAAPRAGRGRARAALHASRTHPRLPRAHRLEPGGAFARLARRAEQPRRPPAARSGRGARAQRRRPPALVRRGGGARA